MPKLLPLVKLLILNHQEKKKSAGKKTPLSTPLPPPDPKNPKLDQTTPAQVNKIGSPSVQPSDSNCAFVVYTLLHHAAGVVFT